MGRLNASLIGGDYSAQRPSLPFWRPHDLAWITQEQASQALGMDAPDWARRALAFGLPVVVRRGLRDALTLPVGIRGNSRDKRFAARIPATALHDRTTPESLSLALERMDPLRSAMIPAMAAVSEAALIFDPLNLSWGIGGAVGYELATQTPATHEHSDIDLLLRLPARPDRAELQELAERLRGLSARCDIQIETPLGGLALADWLSGAERVMIKSDQGPYLVADPWAVRATEHDGRDPCR